MSDEISRPKRFRRWADTLKHDRDKLLELGHNDWAFNNLSRAVAELCLQAAEIEEESSCKCQRGGSDGTVEQAGERENP